jgi:hypothetical protein
LAAQFSNGTFIKDGEMRKLRSDRDFGVRLS